MTATLNQQEKHVLVLSYARPYGLLVETGLWNGGGVCVQAAAEGLVAHAVDMEQANCDAVRARGVTACCGDSAELLPHLLYGLDRPACFWLDAHYAVEGDAFLAAHPCPLLGELLAILAWPHAGASTVLVDDLRLLGAPGWPDRLALAGLELGAVWEVSEAADILRLTPTGKV